MEDAKTRRTAGGDGENADKALVLTNTVRFALSPGAPTRP